jgi:prefoldin subunit 5
MNIYDQNYRIEQLEKMRAEYNEIMNFIQEINKTLTKKTIIPIQDNLAYFLGDIKKTNQCRVYLGEDYYIETTNHRAIKILETRLQRLENLLIEQNQIIESNVNELVLPTEEVGTFEIKEEINDQDYKRLKEKKDFNVSDDIDSNLREKLKAIKIRREQQENDNEMVLIRKNRKKDNEIKSKDVITLDKPIQKAEKVELNLQKKSLFLEDDNI